MKKTLLLFLLLFGISQTNYSQAVGILGTALNGYDVADIDLTQISQNEFVLKNQLFSTGTVKFRKDDSWTINWGSADFPNGIGVQDGPNIPITAGMYDVYFKINTGLYSFYQHENIGIIGTAVSSNGFTGDDINLSTVDNINFSIYYPFLNGTMKIRKDDAWTTNWGSADFPSGTGTQDGVDIPVPAGNYLFTINIQTGAYSFSGTTTYPTISIVGTASSGWGTDIDMITTDGVTYTLTNYALSNGELKFRQDYAWTTSWGGTNFPSGTGILNSSNNIPIPAGVYDITFNRINGTYTFIGTPFPSIGIWGPAVNSQLGYTAPDVDMNTIDGIHYTLSGFYFSSGNAYFRQDNDSGLTWGSTIFPSGTAVSNGPSLFIPGNEWFVTFNRVTGDYSFTYPSIGILGTALNGFDVADTDLTTTDGFNYSISDLTLTDGEVKFRKDNLWTSNWGSAAFPSGTGTQDGANIPVTAGNYHVTFDKSTGNYNFILLLSSDGYNLKNIVVFPNPTNSNWNFSSTEMIDSVEITDVLGKTILKSNTKSENIIIDASQWNSGIYFAKITIGSSIQTVKLIKN